MNIGDKVRPLCDKCDLECPLPKGTYGVITSIMQGSAMLEYHLPDGSVRRNYICELKFLASMSEDIGNTREVPPPRQYGVHDYNEPDPDFLAAIQFRPSQLHEPVKPYVPWYRRES